MNSRIEQLDLTRLATEGWFNPLRVELQKAIVSHFDTEDWKTFGYETNLIDPIRSHPRLLRSLGFGDPDYGGCVYQMIETIEHCDVRALAHLILHDKLLPVLWQTAPRKLEELGVTGEHVHMTPAPPTASHVVKQALEDAHQLIATNGPVSAVDRLHTALHGYLRDTCTQAHIPLANDATITAAFKALRTQHPAFTQGGAHDEQVQKILMSFAATVDALNTLRNHASVAHPNQQLLGRPEADLVTNAVRTIFNYLSARI